MRETHRPTGARLWQSIVRMSFAAVILAACPECIGGVLDTGDRAIDRRQERDNRFEQVEPGPESRR